jgi:cyanophycin synthetase
MKILDTLVMRGPNCWSITHHKLIVLKLELQSSERGLSGYMVATIARQLQQEVGVECSFAINGEPRMEDRAEAIFEFVDEEVGLLAAGLAVKIAESLWREKHYEISGEFRVMEEAWEYARRHQLNLAITDEAIKRNIPCISLNKRQLVQLGYGANQRRIQTTHTDRTSIISMKIAGDKQLTKDLLGSFGVPVPQGRLVSDKAGLLNAIKKIGYPVVLKPVGGNKGNGVNVNISTLEEAIGAFESIRGMSGQGGVVVEKFIRGSDFRFLVIDHKFVAAAKRTPAMVIGDGVSTIAALLEIVNSDPRRGTGHSKPLTIIEADQETLKILQRSGLSLKTVLPIGKIQFLKSIANLSAGGTATDVTDLVHPENVFIAERISRIVGLDICGMDIISPDIEVPFRLNGGSLIEVNSGPGLRLHMEPTEGKPRNVAGSVIDMLFPEGSSSRIPIIAVAGSGKKGIVCGLIEQLMSGVGYRVGSATSKGVISQNFVVYGGDATGYAHAELVLKDPAVDLAVFECSSAAIYGGGLAFLNCDIGIVLDLDAGDVAGAAALAVAVVPGCILPSGYAILNADNETVYQMHKGLECNVAYFSVAEENPRITEHLRKGGRAAVVENGYITSCHGFEKTRVVSLDDGLTELHLKYPFVILHMLAVVLVGAVYRVDVVTVREILRAFKHLHLDAKIIT